MSRHCRAAMCLSLAALFSTLGTAAWAQFGPAGPKIEYKTATLEEGVHPGAQQRVVLSFQLELGWHVNSNKPLDAFSIPTELSIEPSPGISLLKTVYPKHQIIKLGFSPDPVAVYEQNFNLGIIVSVAADAAVSPHILKGRLRYQACNDKQCAPPTDLAVEITVNVLAPSQAVATHGELQPLFDSVLWAGENQEAAPQEKKGAKLGSVEPEDVNGLLDGFVERGRLFGYAGVKDFRSFIDQAEKGTWDNGNRLANKNGWLVLVLVLAGGLLLNLTPCVLPLIPITIAIIGAGARAGSRARGFALGGAYGLGIALVYGALGLVVVLGLSTAFGAINSTVWFNAAIAVLFLLLGLAMFEIVQIDFSRFQARIGLRRNERGNLAIAFVMGAISALLAGACVAPVVIYTILYAQDQYAKGQIAALFLPFLLGAGMALPWPFAGAGLSFLPKPGAWMLRVKQAFGVFIIAFALYYAHLAYGIFAERHSVDQQAVARSAAEEAGWVTSLEAGLKQARAENKPVLLDFWATWCKNCLVMNSSTLKAPEVRERLNGYVRIKYQAEDPGKDPVKAVWGHFGLQGLPTYIMLQPKGK